MRSWQGNAICFGAECVFVEQNTSPMRANNIRTCTVLTFLSICITPLYIYVLVGNVSSKVIAFCNEKSIRFGSTYRRDSGFSSENQVSGVEATCRSPDETHLGRHVEIVDKHDGAFSDRGSKHTAPSLVQLPVNLILSHVSRRPSRKRDENGKPRLLRQLCDQVSIHVH